MSAIVEVTVNGETEVALKDGVPLTVNVTISSSDAHPVSLGAPVSPWWEKVAIFGSDGRQMFWPFEVLAHRPSDNVVTLGPGDVAELELGIAPEDLGTVRTGSYGVRVRVTAPGDAEPAESNEVTVSIIGTALTDVEAASADHLVTLATFLTKRGRHMEARATIDQLLARHGASVNELLLLAQLQEQQGDVDGAIQTYERAEATYSSPAGGADEAAEVIATRALRLRRARARAAQT